MTIPKFIGAALLLIFGSGLFLSKAGAVDDFRPLLDTAIREKRAEVVIPPGTYRLKPLNGGSVHVRVKEARDLVIRAEGVTLICEELTRAVAFENCKNVKLTGLTVDYDPLPYTQGKIVAIAPDFGSIDIRLDAGYPRVAYSRIDIIDPKTRFRKRGMPFLWGTKGEMVDESTVRISLKDIGKAALVGDLATVSGSTRPGGSPHGITIDESEGMVFEKVSVFSAPGFGIFESGGDGGMRYSECRVLPGPKPAGATEERMLSSVWDAMQTAAVKKGPLVENCEIREAGDDSWSVQSTDFMVLAVEGSKAIVAFRNPYDSGFKTGDRLVTSLRSAAPVVTGLQNVDLKKVVLDEKTRSRLEGAEPYSLWKVSDKAVEVTVDGLFPFPVGTSIYTPDRQCNGFVFRNNRLHNTGRILIKGGDGLIEGNQIVDGHAGVTVAPELPGNGSQGIRNLTIRNNSFDGTGYYCPGWWSTQAGCISITAGAEKNQFMPAGTFEKIVIENNRFEDFNGPGIVVTSASDVVIKDNIFSRVMGAAPNATGGRYGIDPEALLWFSQSDKITVSGNLVYEPGSFLKKIAAGKDMDAATLSGAEAGVKILPTETSPWKKAALR